MKAQPILSEQSPLKIRQKAFANHLRNPGQFAAPERSDGSAVIEERRLVIYRDLFFNNIEGLISGAFPILRSIYDDQDWMTLIRQFFTEHHCRTPYFPKVAKEFVDYVQHELDTSTHPIFIAELVDFEWTDIEVRHSLIGLRDHYQSIINLCSQDDLDSAKAPNTKSNENTISNARPYELCSPASKTGLIDLAPRLQVAVNPTLLIKTYQYPVHQISKNNQPSETLNTPIFFAIYRDINQNSHCVSLSPIAANLLAQLATDSSFGLQTIMDQFFQQDMFSQQPPEQLKLIKDFAYDAVWQWLSSGIVCTYGAK